MPATNIAPAGARGSLQTRLMVTVTVVLGTFLAVMGWVLERSFAASVLSGAEEQLRLVVYGLLGAAEEHDDTLEFPDELGDPRLSMPDSGLYAYVDTASGTVIWRSPSLLVTAVDMSRPRGARRPPPGSSRFAGVDDDARPTGLFRFGYTVVWEDVEDAELTFWVLADQAPFRTEIASFRRSMALGLVGATFLLVVAQIVALRWGLRPVRRMTERIGALQAGEREDIGEDYPRELSGLAGTLNSFVERERENRERYRRAMGDLAHSLKTPLAVLTNASDGLPSGDKRLFEEQLQRMENTVAHQLSRAAALRAVVPRETVAVGPLLERLGRTLDKAYAAKAPILEMGGDAHVRGDERDLLEMLGNLLENACKYCRSRVRVAVQDGATVRIVVDDDGPGIPPEARAWVLERGARADSGHAGQGIGLAVVVELASAYGGRLVISDSDLGGARLALTIPRG